MYVIRVGSDSWYDGSAGDPGRTCRIEYAVRFRTVDKLIKTLSELRRQYPHRTIESEWVAC